MNSHRSAVEADKPNVLAMHVDRIAVDDINIVRIHRVGMGGGANQQKQEKR
jgi:hypothetical protein